MSARPALTFVLVILAASCGGTAAQTKPSPALAHANAVDGEGAAWLAGRMPADLSADAYVFGVGRGATRDAARAAAWASLLGAVGLPPSDAAVLTRATSVERAAEAEGARVVLMAAPRATVAANIDAALIALAAALEPGPPSLAPPERLGQLLARMDAMTKRDALCVVLARLGRPECAPLERGAVEEDVRALGRGLRLAPRLATGVPYVRGQIPLRPAAVAARFAEAGQPARPWPKLPLMAVNAPPGLAGDRAFTAADGQAVFAFTATPAGARELVIALDRAALLGAHRAELFPSVTTTVSLRPLVAESLHYLVELTETVEAEGVPRAKAATALGRALGEARVTIVAPEGAVAAAGEPSFDGLIEKTGGRGDVLLRGSVRCGFSARMASRSVWYEATATVEAFDLWTGRRLGALDVRAQEVGIGDTNAAERTLARLGADLGAAVAALLRQSYPGEPTAAAGP